MKVVLNFSLFLAFVVGGTVHGSTAPCGPPKPDSPPLQDRDGTPPQETSSFGCKDKPVDVCIAIDMSGSVCTPPGWTPQACNNCHNNCRNWSLDRNVCCGNFQDTMQFAKALATKVDDEISSNSQFALVSFATEATAHHALSDLDTFKTAVNNLDYSGGWTNTGNAIRDCFDYLKNGDSDNEKVLVLVTDGTPTNGYPDLDAGDDDRHKEWATQQADIAKDAEMTILPVLINTVSSDNPFLSSLGSSPSSSTVVSFHHLQSKLDEIAAKVACGKDENSNAAAKAVSTSASCTDEPVDVCVSIDMSGSVCTPAGWSPQACNNCHSNCHQDGYHRNVCCFNFEMTMKFAKDLVSKVDADISNESQFSLVTFATHAVLQSDLDSKINFIDAVDSLDYSGGWTDTGDSIHLCTEALKDSTSTEKVIVLLTDGTPTNSPNKEEGDFQEHKDWAVEKANEAKNLGITILPILINTVSADNDFLSDLGTDPASTTVTTFETIEDELDAIADMVKCA